MVIVVMIDVNQNCSRVVKRHCGGKKKSLQVPLDRSPETCVTTAETSNREILKLVTHAWAIIRAS